ncbi:MAG: Asp-tRNA(Asn)/Glu-tRNA(Gln) amidotransferase subunit GatA [Phycisphaerales bacterium]|nr:Asp-tRNA(Asn)/Glu-tRNA(Gln) amidotransferase subunit GatA [Phycisphaerales bacterium]
MSLNQSATQIASDVASRLRSAVDVCAAALSRAEAVNPRLNAFTQILRHEALCRARQIDAAIARGEAPGPLAGVPIALKDNICTRIGHTTCASRMLESYRSPYDATVVQRLERAGAVIVAKTNLDEFAMGSSTENSAFGVVRNPWSPDRVAGGSSGGSAVAVATRTVPLALGSDTGGSIRLPASFSGVIGLKPTYGRVSRYGLVAYGSSLDQIGPFATYAADAALLLSVIAGRDPNDATSADRAESDFSAAARDVDPAHAIRKLRIGIPREFFADGLDPVVRDQVEKAICEYRAAGAHLVEIALPHTKYCVATYYLIATAEASSNLARFDGVHYGHRTPAPRDIHHLYSASRDEGLGTEVKRRIMLGTFALSAGYADAFYQQALRVRRLIRDDYSQAFGQVDVIMGPVAPSTAFRIGEKADDPLQMYLADVYTTSANLAGLPAISIPCGFSASGLPVGLQVIAPAFEEARLLSAARFLEQRGDWHSRIPPIE